MADYEVLLSPQVQDFLAAADEKTERIVRDNLAYLGTHPYPGRGRGDTEQLHIDGEERYRIPIGRTWTAFYDIYGSDAEVGVLEIVPIGEAYDRYGFG